MAARGAALVGAIGGAGRLAGQVVNRVATVARGALVPMAGTVSSVDPLSLGESLAHAAVSAAFNPEPTLAAGGRYASGLVHAGLATAARLARMQVAGPIAPEPGDKRFADEAWQRSPYFFWRMESYLLARRLVDELLAAADGLDPITRGKAEFAARLAVDAMAPSNFLFSNPVALRKAVQTRGRSLLRGLRNLGADVLHNGGYPRHVPSGAFAPGVNLAMTPGKVVHRTRLFELLQYAPQTDTVHQVPILCSPPWINKYYVMDLAPRRSLIEWAVQHGHTVFCLSYKNPDESMRDVSMEDYLAALRSATDAVLAITGSPKVNLVGVCLGGLLASCLMAQLAQKGDGRVHTATLLNTLTDYSSPGVLGCFTDERTVERLAERMKKHGFLDAVDMARTFNLLRPQDLLFNYVTNNWLLGEDPPAFDILAWNGDATRMPAAMHEWYLRNLYVRNLLAREQLVLGGSRLSLKDVKSEVYVLSAKEDHIAPWRASFAATRLFGGPVRFVLSSAGHIAGIINPPTPKAVHWTNDKLDPDPDRWFAGASKRPGTWWEDWSTWIAARAGERVAPPPMGSSEYPAREDAPGQYVREN